MEWLEEQNILLEAKINTLELIIKNEHL